ncbi:hypothetical protein BJY16_005125 [Actinoplanes octamycinicus]|uniref:CATRA-Associated Small Protein domain-containing protein n=1 Tax=Actinoplanes octamycinicus TaxID=135948 RepID=A0A7W7H0D5_9ACTN|nr:CATRA system-associated protein [Actinoplanes octamycinicus]MBB4741666.1 hypothetical protein [Actinoplanes octamycinicus]GIE57219.1 hypothetical protein Aoc01nite_26210 [Actinoplanes octamycinicus]
MSTVRLLLTSDDAGLDGTPLVVTAHPMEGRGGQPFVARIGEPRTVTATGPQCGFAVALPGGGTVTAAVVLDDGDRADLEVGLPDAHALFTTADSQVWGAFTDPGHRDCWIRLWRRTGDSRGWAVVPWPAEPAVALPDRVTFRMEPPSGALVQTGGRGLTPKFSVLPEASHVEVTVRPAAGPVPRLATYVTTGDLIAEVLRGYLWRGNVSACRRIAALDYGHRDVGTHLARGYLLMRGAAELLPDLNVWHADDALWWPDADGVREPADVAAIHGTLLWEAGQREEATAAFQRAGIPAYPEGLRLLATGLRRLRDPASLTLLERLLPTLDAADLSEPTTAWFGASPDQPSRDARDDDCAHLPHRFSISALFGTPAAGFRPPAADRELLAEVQDLLTDVPGWTFTADRWARVGVLLDDLRSALLAADLEAFLERADDLEMQAPFRDVQPGARLTAMPPHVGSLLAEVRELLARMLAGEIQR